MAARAACPEACGECPGSCEDSSSWLWRASSKGCSWMAKHQGKCTKTNKQKPTGAEACPASCGTCD